jgi:hypothetical protein
MKNQNLVDYKYIDHSKLDMLVDQIPRSHSKNKIITWKVALSLTGPSVEVGTGTSRDISTYEKIDRLVGFLTANKLISLERPLELSGGWHLPSLSDHTFILETMTARKVILPSEYTERINGLRGFAVWISDPAEKDLSVSDFTFRGTFIYLTEMHWDDEGLARMQSGCSALQAVMNIANRENLEKTSGGEPLGRGNSDHPLQKLERLGGIVTDTRTITSLYTVRYMTNEQCYTVNGREFRVNDLLGYPIFIY